MFSSDWNKYAQQTYAANFGEPDLAVGQLECASDLGTRACAQEYGAPPPADSRQIKQNPLKSLKIDVLPLLNSISPRPERRSPRPEQPSPRPNLVSPLSACRSPRLEADLSPPESFPPHIFLRPPRTERGSGLLAHGSEWLHRCSGSSNAFASRINLDGGGWTPLSFTRPFVSFQRADVSAPSKLMMDASRRRAETIGFSLINLDHK